MKKVYVAHPYGAREDNKGKAEDVLVNLYKRHEDILFLSPIHSLGYIYLEVDYELGMVYCFELLSLCSEIWIFGDWQNSRGCRLEYEFAKENGIDVYIGGY